MESSLDNVQDQDEQPVTQEPDVNQVVQPEQTVMQETTENQAAQPEQPTVEASEPTQEIAAEQPAVETRQVYTEQNFIEDYKALCERSGFELSFSSFPQFSPTNHGTFELEVKQQVRVVKRDVQQG